MLGNPNPRAVLPLLDAGADANARDKDGRTALILFAGYYQDPVVVKALLDAGADVNAQDAEGNTALILEAKYSDTPYSNSPACMQALVDAGADVTLQDNAGNTAWEYIKHNDALKGTKAYRRMSDLQRGK